MAVAIGIELPGLEQRHPAVDRVQRRAQFVGDRRDELVLRAAEGFRVAAAGLFLREQRRAVSIDLLLCLVALAHPRLEDRGCLAERDGQIVSFRDAGPEKLDRFTARQQSCGVGGGGVSADDAAAQVRRQHNSGSEDRDTKRDQHDEGPANRAVERDRWQADTDGPAGHGRSHPRRVGRYTLEQGRSPRAFGTGPALLREIRRRRATDVPVLVQSPGDDPPIGIEQSDDAVLPEAASD